MKQKKLPTVASLAMATVVVAPAWSAEEGTTEISEIVVTATRMETNLQDTPIAITAVTADALEERGITGVGELTSLVPNAQFRRTQGAFGPGVSASIRGVGQADTSLAVEPAVAFYLDDVYYPLLLGSNFDLLDIDRIEVLRGPQGTLFGRNSLAGAVNIVSRQPSTTEFSSQAQVTFGAYDRRELRAGVNLPLSDEVALSLSGLSKKRTGYQRDTSRYSWQFPQEMDIVRVELERADGTAATLEPLVANPDAYLAEGSIRADGRYLVFCEHFVAEVTPVPPEAVRGIRGGYAPSPDPDDHRRRSVYLFAKRNFRFPFLEVFDAPDSNLSCPERGRSTTAPQSLTLLNAPEVMDAAKALAKVMKVAAAAV